MAAMAHLLSHGGCYLPTDPPKASRPPPSSLSWPAQPNLPFHLSSPVAHRWFFSATHLRANAAVLAGAPSSATTAATRLIAQNIPWAYTCDDVRALFSRHGGTVLHVELSMHNSSRNRGLAFVDMATEREAEEALNHLNSLEVDGRVIRVEYARSIRRDRKKQQQQQNAGGHNVFVGNLTYRVRSRDLRELFGAFNPNVLSAEVVFQSNPRRSAGYGFACFASMEEAQAAIAALTGKRLMGRSIRLSLGKNENEVKSNEEEEEEEERQTEVAA